MTLFALICPSVEIPPFAFNAPVVLLVEAVVFEITISFEKVFAPEIVCAVSIVTYFEVMTFPAPSCVAFVAELAVVAEVALPDKEPIKVFATICPLSLTVNKSVQVEPLFPLCCKINTKEELTFFEEKAKEDSSIQTFQIDEEAFLYLNFNETPQPSLRELEKMVKEIQVAEVNEEEEEKETDQQPDILQDREQWDLSGDIIDCFRRYSSELLPEEQEEIIKGIEEGLTDQDVKRYFTLVGAEKMRQYRRVLMVAK